MSSKRKTMNYFIMPGIRMNKKEKAKIREAKMNEILDCISDHFGLTRSSILSKNRSGKRPDVRQAISYVAIEWFAIPASFVARFLGNHHTTILTNRKRVEDLISIDDWIKDDIIQIHAKLNK